MKKKKVKVVNSFIDKDKVTRKVNEILNIEEDRIKNLKNRGFITTKLTDEEIEDEITKEMVQAVAIAIQDEAKEKDKTVNKIIDEIIEESNETT